MDKTEKLFRKISKKERLLLKELVLNLENKETNNLNIRKVTDSDFYHFRKNRFRIIFHYENKTLIIDSIKLKNDKTYKNLLIN